jgi:hypothetical protein
MGWHLELAKRERMYGVTAAPMDSCVVPHRSTNRAVLWLTAQIRRDAVLSESYGRRHVFVSRIRLHACRPTRGQNQPALNQKNFLGPPPFCPDCRAKVKNDRP